MTGHPPDALLEVAQALRRLRQADPQHPRDVAAWEAQAREFTRWHLGRWPDIDLPPQVMFYLHDADIRVREPEYRSAQDEMIDDLIASLERGIVPASTTRQVTIHPRWLGVLALIVLVAVWSCARG